MRQTAEWIIPADCCDKRWWVPGLLLVRALPLPPTHCLSAASKGLQGKLWRHLSVQLTETAAPVHHATQPHAVCSGYFWAVINILCICFAVCLHPVGYCHGASDRPAMHSLLSWSAHTLTSDMSPGYQIYEFVHSSERADAHLLLCHNSWTEKRFTARWTSGSQTYVWIPSW